MKKISLFLLIVILLVSCTPKATEIPLVTEEPPTPDVEATPLATLEPEARVLNVCLGEEPNTLYPYGTLNAAARSVLSAVYDGPMDVTEYEYEPIILEKIPNLEDGDAQLFPTPVKEGDLIVDAQGSLTNLKLGTQVHPSGCRAEDCVVKYDGKSEVQMDQMVVTFVLLEGLMWSDGTALTANDSVFSFELASHKDTPGSKFLIDRTQTYEAADEITAQWWGVPGFIDPDYFTNFWMPLPQHLWSEQQPADLPRLDISSRTPLGWGPYLIQEWKEGESIHLIKNLNYFRASSNLPHFDELNFIIMPNANAALTGLVDGTCDVLDPSVRLDGQVGLLQQMETDRQAILYTAQTTTMEWLGIGVDPASYDNGFSQTTDRPDLFGDERMRQALALCLNRQKVVDTVLFGLSQVPDSYLPSDHPLHNGNLPTYAYNPQQGSELLTNIGWLDGDNNPSTPRIALGVTNVPATTPLILNYITSTATQRHQVAEILTQSLAECGIGLNVTYLNAADLYAQGPLGPLFGRNFELAAYAIGVNTLEPQCGWFTTSQTPTEENNWVGTNVSGYKNPTFDAACQKALLALPGEPNYTAHQEAQNIFAAELPSIPLYVRLKVAASRHDFCGFSLDPSASSSLADIETFNYGDTCK